MSAISPKTDGKWMKFIEKISDKWSQEIEKEQARELLKVIQLKYFPEISDSDKYLLQFRLRACLYMLQKEYILKHTFQQMPAEELQTYAEEFCFENCEIEKNKIIIVKKYVR